MVDGMGGRFVQLTIVDFLVGRFWFRNPGISDPGQRAGPEIVVETIRNALLDAGWRPSS